MGPGLLGFFEEGQKKTTVAEFMEHSSYDELLEIDIKQDRFKVIYHIEQKYHLPLMEGSFSSFCAYFLEHMVHPEDRESYKAEMDLKTLEERLAHSSIPGVLDIQFRLSSPDGEWRWVEQFLLEGEQNGIRSGIINCYIFDIQNLKDRESGVTKVRTTEESSRRDPLTGLHREKDFFTAANKLLKSSMKYRDWMIIAIDLEEFKLFNEWYGRETGDLVLAALGSGLAKRAKAGGGIAGYTSVCLSPQALSG